MKIPKRYIEIAPFEFEHQIPPEHILEQRFKRKNRIRQLKHTITLQNKEIKHLREECARLEREKQQAYHTGHADGYNAGFAQLMF